MLNFDQLRKANDTRAKHWNGPERGSQLGILFASVEAGGETGEALNKVKKYVRHLLGMPGGADNLEEVKDEIADMVITADLLAAQFNVDLGECVRTKFNKTSRKHDMPVAL